MDDLALPASQRAEQAVLGAIIIDGTLYPKAAELTVEDFDRPRHKPIWSAMQAIVAEGRKIDTVTLSDALQARGALTEVTHAYLGELMVAPALTSNLEYYVGIVADKAARRRAVATLQTALAGVLAEDVDLGHTLTATAAELGHIAAGGASSHVSSRDLAYATVERIQAAHQARRDHGEAWVPGLATGIMSLDATLGGFERGHYHLIAGETSMGKSAFALYLARQFAEDGAPGAFISLEDHQATMGLRVLAGTSGLNAQHLRFGIARDVTFFDSLSKGATRAANLPIRWVFDVYTLPHVLRALRQAKEQAGIQWAIVDYIQLVQAPAKGKRQQDTRALELANVSQSFQRAAKDLDIALISLSQLKRIEGRKDRRPYLSDLRDSGSLEQDCYTATFISRPGKDSPSDEWPADKAVAIVAKNKNGPPADIALRFIEKSMTFEPWDTVHV